MSRLTDNPPGTNMGLCLALGTSLGVSLGVTIGVVLDNIALGVAIGPGIGASIGLAAYFVIESTRREPFTCRACGYSTRGLPPAPHDADEPNDSHEPNEPHDPNNAAGGEHHTICPECGARNGPEDEASAETANDAEGRSGEPPLF